MAKTNVYRVSYLFRPSKDANPQEKVVFVVADTDVQAVGYVNSLLGFEVTGASEHVKNAMLVSTPIGKVFEERRVGKPDTRPMPRAERRHGAPDTRVAETPALKPAVAPKPAVVPPKPAVVPAPVAKPVVPPVKP
jgi:hypothetical protein